MQLDFITYHTRRAPNSLACVDLETDRHWSYSQFDAQINRIANMLVEKLSPCSGSRVAAIAYNSAELLMLYQACVRAGAIFVPCNWRLSTTEIRQILEDSAPALVFYDEALMPEQEAGNEHLITTLEPISQSYPKTPPPNSRQMTSEASLLLYTSGTSGRPKGVMISETNAYWGATAFNLGNQVHSDSVFLCDMPMFHTAGLLANAIAPLVAGGAVLVSRGFDVDKTLRRLSDRQLAITHYFSVPQMASRLRQHPDFVADNLCHLAVYATGGAPNPKVQIERFIKAGINMSDGFGMTETCSVSGMPIDDPQKVLEKAGSSGIAYFSLQTLIVDAEGNPLPSGEVGELWLRGPGIASQGYWNQPDKTQEAFSDGWFKTGDMARIDSENFLFIVDRKKDMFISGGENVYSAEVENVIAKFPGILEVAVVGIADDTWGEIGVACIVAEKHISISEQALTEYCREHLAHFKVPKHIDIRDELPYTSTGKIQKQKLRQELIAWLKK